MKLATLKDSTRDGKLVVVSKDLTRCSEVGHIARSLQAALDDWEHVSPRLERVAEGVETGSQPTMRFHEHDAASPLPRAYFWAGGSGGFSGPRDPVHLAKATSDVTMTAQLAAIVDDVPAGVQGAEASKAVLLVLIASDILVGGAVAASTFSPVAVTPDELGDLWSGGKATISLAVSRNGKAVVPASAPADFAGAVSVAASTRPLGVGSIVAAGGAEAGQALSSGDTVRVELNDRKGHSIFGAIEQDITAR